MAAVSVAALLVVAAVAQAPSCVLDGDVLAHISMRHVEIKRPNKLTALGLKLESKCALALAVTRADRGWPCVLCPLPLPTLYIFPISRQCVVVGVGCGLCGWNRGGEQSFPLVPP